MFAFIFFYVDDFLVAGTREDAQRAKKMLKSMYQMRDLGNSQWFLGIRISRDRTQKKLWLQQDSYIQKLIEKYEIPLMKPATYKVPIRSCRRLDTNDDKATPQGILQMQRLIGSSLYLALITRPDITIHVNFLADHTLNPSKDHIEAAKDIIAYCYHTKNLAIAYTAPQFDNESKYPLTCYSDASFASRSDYKSTAGYLFTLYGGPTVWRTTKQRSITDSSTEAELTAMSAAMRELYKRFL
jgi:hypothetical protein